METTNRVDYGISQLGSAFLIVSAVGISCQTFFEVVMEELELILTLLGITKEELIRVIRSAKNDTGKTSN